MLTLLGSLLRFLSSAFLEFLKLFRDSQGCKANSPSWIVIWSSRGWGAPGDWKKSRSQLYCRNQGVV